MIVIILQMYTFSDIRALIFDFFLNFLSRICSTQL